MKSPQALPCQRCGQVKSASDFHMNNTKPHRLNRNGICKDCQSEVDRDNR